MFFFRVSFNRDSITTIPILMGLAIYDSVRREQVKRINMVRAS